MLEIERAGGQGDKRQRCGHICAIPVHITVATEMERENNTEFYIEQYFIKKKHVFC